jgi:peroxiredoxin Q/BCP
MKEEKSSKYFQYFLYTILFIMAGEIFFLINQNRKLQAMIGKQQPEREIMKGLDLGSVVPSFSRETISHTTFNIDEVKGSKVVTIFFSTKCPGCIKDIDNWKHLYDLCLKNNTKVLGVSTGDKATINKFAELYDLKFDIIADTTGNLSGLYKVGIIPQKLIINENSQVEYISHGYSNQNELSALIDIIKGT